MYVSVTCHSLHEGSEDSLKELVFSFHHVGPRDRTQVIGLACKQLYLLDHFGIPVHLKNKQTKPKTLMPFFEATDCMNFAGLS